MEIKDSERHLVPHTKKASHTCTIKENQRGEKKDHPRQLVLSSYFIGKDAEIREAPWSPEQAERASETSSPASPTPHSFCLCTHSVTNWGGGELKPAPTEIGCCMRDYVAMRTSVGVFPPFSVEIFCFAWLLPKHRHGSPWTGEWRG